MRLAARYADGFDIGRRGVEGRDLAPDEMAAAIGELRAIERAVGRTAPLRTSHWGPVALGEADELLRRVRGFADTGLDQFLCAVPRERSLETSERAARTLLPVLA